MKSNQKETRKQLAKEELHKILGGTPQDIPALPKPLKITPKQPTPFYHS